LQRFVNWPAAVAGPLENFAPEHHFLGEALVRFQPLGTFHLYQPTPAHGIKGAES
jgi:hypothetical protein